MIAADGRHSWLGRNNDPTDAKLVDVAAALERAGIPGWLAVTEGVYYSSDALVVLLVRPLWGEGDWEAALAAFHDRRRESLAATG